MDSFQEAFNKLKAMKKSVDDSADEAEQGLVKSSMALGIPEDQAKLITQNAQSGSNMAGSIEDVGAQVAKKMLGSGVAKLFRDPEAAAPVANRAAKIADFEKTMDMGKFLKNPEQGLLGKGAQGRLDGLPEYAKQEVLKAMRAKGIDPSKLGQ